MQLFDQRRELDAAVLRRERLEAADRLLQLSLGTDPAAAAGLVPRDCDVNESLEEVALLRRRGPPRFLELLVRGEVLAGADQLEALIKAPSR
jgi:hypothetical protein